jgi:hypothetical protein
MKQYYCILFLLFSFSFYAQNDTIPVVKMKNLSVVSAARMNVVYRGVPNPISIAVNNAKSYTVSGNGVSLQNGIYVLRAGAGKETKVIVEIENFDGSKVIEEHFFRIKGLPYVVALINGYGCGRKCIVEASKEELLNSEISVDFVDFLFDVNIKVESFTINFIDINSKKVVKSIDIKGNKINETAYFEIKNLIKGSSFFINNLEINIENIDLLVCKIAPLKILIID